jgi:hypothetical protein
MLRAVIIHIYLNRLYDTAMHPLQEQVHQSRRHVRSHVSDACSVTLVVMRDTLITNGITW